MTTLLVMGKYCIIFLRQSKLVEYNEEEDHEIALEKLRKN
jgi:hypothetical protein